MATTTLSAEKDPMGAAISDYFNHHRADRLRVFSSQFEEDEIPVKELFRSIQSMPILERTALQMATGRILDVGAGSGCHALALQEMGKEVCAIDISPLSVEVMQQRGVNDPRLINLFDETFTETFDTILMLMNGSGIIGRLNNMPGFFQRMKRILRPGGCILMDSSDLRYLFEEEDGSIVIDLAGDYYGEIDFQMQYKDVKGDTFDWLYLDFQTLSLYASECGFKAELVKARIKALENNIDDAEVHKVYKSANKDEINWLKYQLQEIELMLKDDTKEYDILYEAMNDNIPYLEIK